MNDLIQFFLGGLGFGGVYALAALGAVLIFNSSGVVNFAFGAMATIVTLLFWTLLTGYGLPLVAVWIVALSAAMVFGTLVDAVIVRRVRREAPLVQIVLTLGLLVMLQGLAGTTWGFGSKGVPRVFAGESIALGPYLITRNDLFVIGMTLFVGLALWVVFERTRFGLALRAVSQDAEVAALMGVRSRWLVSAAWGVGTVISSIAVMLVAPQIGAYPAMAEQILIFAFAGAILGGFGSLLGAVVGGFLIGILANLVGAYLSYTWQTTAVFLLIVGMLYLRPRGLFNVELVNRQ